MTVDDVAVTLQLRGPERRHHQLQSVQSQNKRLCEGCWDLPGIRHCTFKMIMNMFVYVYVQDSYFTHEIKNALLWGRLWIRRLSRSVGGLIPVCAPNGQVALRCICERTSSFTNLLLSMNYVFKCVYSSFIYPSPRLCTFS